MGFLSLGRQAVGFLTELPSIVIPILIAGFIGSLCLCTWLLSTVQSIPRPAGKRHEPPVAPYWIPYFQHMPQFLTNPNETFEMWKQRYPSTPFTLLMMGTKFHVFNSSDTVAHVFSKSRDFVFEPVVESMMANGLNLPPSDLTKFRLPSKPHSQLSEKELESRDFCRPITQPI